MKVLFRYILVFFIYCLPLPISAVSIDIVVSNVSSPKGNIIIALYNNAATFTKKGYEYKTAIVKTKSNTTTYQFKNIATGNYAAVAFHDENANIKLDKRFGIPIEPFGFSNKAKTTFGPPKFSDALVRVLNEDKTIYIELN